MIRAATALVLAFAFPVNAEAFSLSLPLDCSIGSDCFVQNYVDSDPTSDAADYRGGSLSYDGHDGTDIRLIDRAAMRRGVSVRAAAAGRVIGLRDGMADVAMDDPAPPDITGRECGNGVLLRHENGWQTQYCHMRKGSIAVREGQRVDRGQVLGQVGLSGQTMFPHVHLSVRKDGRDVDPFTVGSAGAPTLWQVPPPYIAGGVLTLGIATEMPDFAAIRGGLATPRPLAGPFPALVIWGYLFGVRKGDTLRLSLRGRDGAIIDEALTLTRTQAQIFRALGRRFPPGAVPAGELRASVALIRDGAVVSRRRIGTRIAP